MKKPLHEICNKTVELMHELYGEPEIDSRMRMALFLAAQESIAKNMKRLNDKHVEEYVYCATVLNLYQLLGKKAEIDSPSDWKEFKYRYKIDFSQDDDYLYTEFNTCCLGGVSCWSLSDIMDAVKICGIDAGFQKECARFGLGGA